MKARSIDHICFVVRDLEASVETYRRTLGIEPDGWYTADSESIRVARFYLENVALELMQPTRPDSEVGRFLENRGEGFFLISYRVDDAAAALQELHALGEPTIDTVPRQLMGNRYAFIQPPARLGGVLTEILDGEFDRSYDDTGPGDG